MAINIMASTQFDIGEVKRVLKRRKKPAFWVAGAVLIIGVLVAILVPPTYVSSSTILIEQQEIPQDLVRSTVTSFADQRIQSITQRTMTFANLSELIKKYDLYADDRKSEPMEIIIEYMRRDIKTKIISADVVDPRSGRPVEATIAFSIKYHSRNAETAQKVAGEITSLFLNENLKNRKEMASLTEEFLGKSLDGEKDKLKALETRLAQFKQEHAKELPEFSQFTIATLERSETELRERTARLDSLQERRIYLKGELARLGASRIVTGGDLNGLTPEDRLRYLYNLSVQLKTQYGPNHPDVIRTNNAINELLASGAQLRDKSFMKDIKQRKEQELQSLESKYAASHPDVIKLRQQIEQLGKQETTAVSSNYETSNNPDYIQLAAQLQAIEQNLISEQSIIGGLQDKIQSLQSSLSQSPKVEQDYRALMRELENANRNFLEYQAKQTQAKLATQLEQEQKGERFTLIEPPMRPEEPVSPNRPLLLVMAVVLSIAAAVGCVFGLEKIDGTVRSEAGLTRLSGIAPLVVIPHLAAHPVERRSALAWQPLAVSAAVALVVISLVHFLYKPLDVVYYILIRKFLG
jgi:uncharacterized protein involved in exopolysaccharide biosynthesis